MDDFSQERSLPFLQGAAQLLHDENRALRQERAAFAAREVEWQAVLAAKEAELSVLVQREAELHENLARREAEWLVESARLAAELAALQELLDQRTQALYGRSTERRPRDKTADKKPKKPRKARSSYGRTAQPDLPEVDVTHTLPPDLRVCDACGGQLTPMGSRVEEAELIAIERRKVVLEHHLRTVYSCACGDCVKTAPGPLKLLTGGRYDISFTVHVAYQKYFAHMPLERQCQMFAHEGLRVTTAALCDQMDALATTLATTYEAIWKVLQAERVLRADETPWAILSNGYSDNQPYYAWVVVGTNYVAFRFLDTRSKEGAETVLGTFAGTLMVDCMTSYPAAAKGKPGEKPKFLVANCHAHARRKFVECEKHWPAESAYAIDLYRQLYDIERDGKVEGADLGMLRDTRSRPLVDELFSWAKVQQQRADILPSTGLYKALGYLVNHEAGFRVFLEDPEVPIDNNESERAVRPTVMGRANYQGSRSERGTQVQAILSTLVESAKRCGVSPEAYLRAATDHALSKAGAVLLPDEFKRQLDALRKPPPDVPSAG